MANIRTQKTRTTKAAKTSKTAVAVKKAVIAKAVKPVSAKIKPSARQTAPVPVKTARAELKSRGVEIPVVNLNGEVTATVKLPSHLVMKKVSDALLAQAVRVYLANQREGSASTKTRGKVEGSTRKIYRQKGTGRARHGSIRAPIFVGGGIAFGPQPRDFSLRLTKKMKLAAFSGALTVAVRDGKVLIVDGVSAMESKTKRVAGFLDTVGKSKRMLIVSGDGQDGFVRASRNIRNVSVRQSNNLNTYDVLSHDRVIFSKEAFMALRNGGREDQV